MRYTLALLALILLLAACGAPSGPTADIQRFADAVVAEDYPAAAKYWLPEAGGAPDEIAALLTQLRADMTKRHGALTGATVRDLDPAHGLVTIIWQLDHAAVATVWAQKQTDAGLRVAWSPFLSAGVAGQLGADGTFATMTPQPPSQAALALTATAEAYATEDAVTYAKRTAIAATWEATATAVAAQATATELARPPEAFLSAKQALAQAGVRAAAQRWSADALLVLVSLKPRGSDGVFGIATDEESALDGTSRVWAFVFASPGLQKVIAYSVEDGTIVGDSGNDAAGYKRMFAGKGAPFDIELEGSLDSDQVATIARENGAKAEDVSDLEISLQEATGEGVLPAPPARWVVGVRGFFGTARITLDGVSGEILANDFGPAGSPGAIPTSIAADMTAPTASATTPTPAPAADGMAALKQSLIAQLAGDGAAPSPDDIAIAGAFARVTFDGGFAFYKLEDGAWKPLTAGTMFPPESMERLGVPRELWV